MLIGLTGKQRVGKNTAYEFIYKHFNTPDRPVIQKSFAKPLKQSVAASLGYYTANYVDLMDRFKDEGKLEITIGREKKTLTGREFLQNYGTEAHREIFGQDFWVNACLPLEKDFHENQIWVCTDVRFANEAQRVHDLGGEVWEILRSINGSSGTNHASEQKLPWTQIDHAIDNDGTLEKLDDKVCDLAFRALTVRKRSSHV